MIGRYDFTEGCYIPSGFRWGFIHSQGYNEPLERFVTLNFSFGKTRPMIDYRNGLRTEHRRWFCLLVAWGIKLRWRFGINWVAI